MFRLRGIVLLMTALHLGHVSSRRLDRKAYIGTLGVVADGPLEDDKSCNICGKHNFKSSEIAGRDFKDGHEYTCQQAQDWVRVNGSKAGMNCSSAQLYWASTCCEDTTCGHAYRPLVASLNVRALFTAASHWKWGWGLLTKSGSYSRQFKDAAAKIPLLSNSSSNLSNLTVTWGDLDQKGLGYTYERDRLKMLGRLSERSGYLVNESTVRGVCDLHPDVLRWLTREKQFLTQFWLNLPPVNGSVCLNTTFRQLRIDVRNAIEEECFAECQDIVHSVLDTYACTELAQVFWDKNTTNASLLFQRIINGSRQCAETPSDTLEALTNFATQKKCHDFHMPRFLWEMDYKAPGEVTQDQFLGFFAPIGGGMFVKALMGPAGELWYGQLASGIGSGFAEGADQTDKARWMQDKYVEKSVCRLPEEHNTTRSKEHIERKGMCPEGSKCKCPQTDIFPRQTTAQLVGNGHSAFVSSGAAAASSLVVQWSIGLLIKTLTQTAALGLATAFTSTLAAPIFLLNGIGSFGARVIFDWATFQCRNTLGCWPQWPDRVKTVNGTWSACRMPDKAKEGGSPVWFMPPPMLRMKHSKGSCVLDTCKLEDYLNQTVGLVRSKKSWKYDGMPSLYNCQPLSFEVMTPPERALFLRKLIDSGIDKEYNLTEASEYITFTAKDPLIGFASARSVAQ